MTPSFWTALATYCQELAPVAGPLLSAVGDTADAVDRAGRPSKTLRTQTRALSTELIYSEIDD